MFYLRPCRGALRCDSKPMDCFATGWQRKNARNRRGHSGWRQCLPQPSVQHHRHRRGRTVRADLGGSGLGCSHCDRFCDRLGLVGCCRLYRDERLGTRQRKDGAGCHPRTQRSARRGLQRRGDHRHAGGRTWLAGRGRLLLCAGEARCAGRVTSRCHQAPDWTGIRKLADIDFRAPWGRYFYQGRRCGRRSCR